MSEYSIIVKGREEVVRSLREMAGNIPEAARRALWTGGSKMMNQSKKWCPVDTGILRASGAVSVPARGGIAVSLGYYTDYAIYVHENMNAYHNPPTKAKFLEDAVNAGKEDMLNEFEAEMKKVVK